MRGITLPVVLAVIAAVVGLAAYRGIRRGGARFYTLERETMLRRASLSLLASVALFLAAFGLLLFNQQRTNNNGAIDSAETGNSEATATPEPVLETSPPTPTATPSPDPNFPTPTPTAIICRAIVDGTAGSGLTLRDAPTGAELDILPDGTILTLLESDPVEANGFTWRQVRTVSREEGWVVEEFLRMGDCR